MRLPWGWGLSETGPRESNATNTPSPADERGIQVSSLNNPAIEPVAKRYDELRYQLLPYNYTLAWQARVTGLPLMRALWLHYPNDPHARGLGNEYLWGRDLLIAPVFQPGATTRDVYLPQGTWYDWWSGERHSGDAATVTRPVDLPTMPIYVRAGAIIPFDPVRQYTAQPVTEPTEIRVYPGADGDFTLYDDDGTSQAYLTGGATYTRFIWDDRSHTLAIEPDTRWRATTPVAPRDFTVVVEPNGRRQTVHYAGARIRVQF